MALTIAGMFAGAGHLARADVLEDPVTGITIPKTSMILVRYGETDRAAGFPKFEYVEVVNARESPLGLDPKIAERINEGMAPVLSVPEGPTVRVRYGETDRAAGMPKYAAVPLPGVPTAAEIRGLPPFGETDFAAGVR